MTDAKLKFKVTTIHPSRSCTVSNLSACSLEEAVTTYLDRNAKQYNNKYTLFVQDEDTGIWWELSIYRTYNYNFISKKYNYNFISKKKIDIGEFLRGGEGLNAIRDRYGIPATRGNVAHIFSRGEWVSSGRILSGTFTPDGEADVIYTSGTGSFHPGSGAIYMSPEGDILMDTRDLQNEEDE